MLAVGQAGHLHDAGIHRGEGLAVKREADVCSVIRTRDPRVER